VSSTFDSIPYKGLYCLTMPGGPTRCQKTELTFQKSPGKHVFERFVQQDEELGREVCVRFTEGTQLSSAVGVRQIIGAR
jgi:hypothetical protein